jgi:rhodanese-related sulfurtransferase
MYSQAYGCFVLLALAMAHIFHLTTVSPFSSLEKQPSFFLSVAVLLYCSCSFVSYIATTIAYNSGYDLTTTVRMDRLFSVIDNVPFAIAMGLLAWMFAFFPLSINPRQALPKWLHYSSWHSRPFRLLYQPIDKQLRSEEFQKY